MVTLSTGGSTSDHQRQNRSFCAAYSYVPSSSSISGSTVAGFRSSLPACHRSIMSAAAVLSAAVCTRPNLTPPEFSVKLYWKTNRLVIEIFAVCCTKEVNDFVIDEVKKIFLDISADEFHLCVSTKLSKPITGHTDAGGDRDEAGRFGGRSGIAGIRQ